MSDVGFFERSVLIGSWVMLIYQELYGARYVLRTLDVDFAVNIAHAKSKLRADLKELITDRGFTDYFDAEGVQKFTGGKLCGVHRTALRRTLQGRSICS